MAGQHSRSPELGAERRLREALNAGFETGADGSIPEQAITAYNQTHPGHPH
jgi:hypothetical protein